jgi:hypothetical protein
MRSLPAFLFAFIMTVIISGALMIGCGGGGGGGGTATTGGNSNTGAANTGTGNTAGNNSACISEGGVCGYPNTTCCSGLVCDQSKGTYNVCSKPGSSNNNTSAVGQVCCTGSECKNTHIDCPAGYACDMFIQLDSSGNGRCYKTL